jgi:hypothetical protein
LAKHDARNASLCFREKNILPHKNVTKRKLPPPVASRKNAQPAVPTGTGRLTRSLKITLQKQHGGPSANEPSANRLPTVIPKGTRLAPLSSDATPQRRRTLRPSGGYAGRPPRATQTSPASPPLARLRPDHQPAAGLHAVPTEHDHRRHPFPDCPIHSDAFTNFSLTSPLPTMYACCTVLVPSPSHDGRSPVKPRSSRSSVGIADIFRHFANNSDFCR